MNDTGARIPCPKCQASNFASSAVCWQCGQPLKAETGNEQPGSPVPPPQPPPVYQPTGPSAPSPADDGQVYVIWGFVMAGLGLLCCPCIFGIAAIVLGVIANSKGNKLGVWVIVAGAASLVLGTVIGIVANTFFRHYLPNLPKSPYMPRT